MKVLVVASQKGGVGKTTLAAHLAVAAERDGLAPVAMIDLDPQGSLAAWWNERTAETPALVATDIARLPADVETLREAGFKLLVVDTPPAMSAALNAVVALADLVVIPVLPSPTDLRAVGNTVDLVESAGRRFAFAVNGAKAGARLTTEAVAALSEHGAVLRPTIAHRVSVPTAAIDGRTVVETEPRRPSGTEMLELWASVKRHLSKKGPR